MAEMITITVNKEKFEMVLCEHMYSDSCHLCECYTTKRCKGGLEDYPTKDCLKKYMDYLQDKK